MSEYRDMLRGLARGIVAKRTSWIARETGPHADVFKGQPNGSMVGNITIAVAEGIEMGIEIGRQAERNEIIDQLKERNGETNDDEACDEVASVEGSARHG